MFKANIEFVKKALRRIGRHYNVTYGKGMDEGTWSEFAPQAEGENQREKKQAEHEIIGVKYRQRYTYRLGAFFSHRPTLTLKRGGRGEHLR